MGNADSYSKLWVGGVQWENLAYITSLLMRFIHEKILILLCLITSHEERLG